ncbi:MAG TPA: hypothetical protein VF598_12800 [Hymenobacter sp.]
MSGARLACAGKPRHHWLDLGIGASSLGPMGGGTNVHAELGKQHLLTAT